MQNIKETFKIIKATDKTVFILFFILITIQILRAEKS